MVTLQQAHEWGLQDKIKYDPTDPKKGVLMVNFQIGKGTIEAMVMVKYSAKRNILGLHTLTQYCCVIDLPAAKLIFREPTLDVSLNFQYRTFEIAGHTIDAMLDTGATGFLWGPKSTAETLGLTLTDVSQQNITASAAGGTASHAL